MILVPKKFITFDASEKTITLTPPYNTVELADLKYIYDETINVTIYDAETRSPPVVSVDTGVITFTTLFEGIADTDELQIFMYDGVVAPDVTSRDHTFKMIDEGSLFRQAYKYDIEDEGVAYMLIKAGTKYPHILLRGLADADLKIEIYHTPTVTLDGAEELAGPFNFNTDKTTLTTWFPGPTVDVPGTYIGTTWIFGGSGVTTPNSSGTTGTMNDFDIVLIPTVDFLLKFINLGGRDMQFMFEAVFVERDYDYSTLG